MMTFLLRQGSDLVDKLERLGEIREQECLEEVMFLDNSPEGKLLGEGA